MATDTICDLIKRLFQDPDDPTVIPLLDAMLGADAFNEVMNHLFVCPDCKNFFDSLDQSRGTLENGLKLIKKLNELNKDKQAKDYFDAELDEAKKALDEMTDDDLKIVNCSTYTFLLFVVGGYEI